MSELSTKRGRERHKARRTVVCFCDSCSRLLYVAVEEMLFCPVCSSAVTPVEEVNAGLSGG